MTYPITTNGHKLLLVEVPEDAKDFSIINGSYSKWLKSKNYGKLEIIDTSSKVSILGTITNGQIDFDCERFMDSMNVIDPNTSYHTAYQDYEHGGYVFFNKDLAFLSLLSANGIPVTGKLICLEIKK